MSQEFRIVPQSTPSSSSSSSSSTTRGDQIDYAQLYRDGILSPSTSASTHSEHYSSSLSGPSSSLSSSSYPDGQPHLGSSDESEEGSEDGETSSDDDDQEPKLKYQRLGAAVNDILKSDSATAMAVHDKFLVLGTQDGTVAILDFNGNKTDSFKPHGQPISELSIDITGEYVGCCSNNGKVVIYGLYSKETIVESYRPSVLCLALDPEFSRRDTRQFVCGCKDGKLILNTKGYFGFGSRNVVLYSGDGPIYAVKWRGSMIAWADNLHVKVYDHSIEERISFIERPKGSPRPDLYRCNLCWETPTRLIIGWADCFKIGQVRERQGDRNRPSKYIEIIAVYQTDYFISGIAPFGEYLVVLAYVEESKDVAQRPELRVITRQNQEVSSDALTIHGFEAYRTNDYRLDALFEEGLFYVVSPHDIVVAKPCDLDDHITWLMERQRYDAALEAAEANEKQLKTHQLVDIGERYLSHLVNTGYIAKAASLCPKILGSEAKLWDKWVFRFSRFRELKAIAPYVPIGNPALSEMAYEVILNDFLKNDHERFLKLINEWPAKLYKVDNIIKTVEETRRTVSEASVLSDALAKLYTMVGSYDKALNIYLRLKRGDVFKLINDHNLIKFVADKVLLLLQFDEAQALELLVTHCDDKDLPINKVVDQLKDEERLLHRYLDALFRKDTGIASEYHELQVDLYAKYEPKSLLNFLKTSSSYTPEKALKTCRALQMYPEEIFILSNIGNAKLALSLIIEKLGDIKQAVEFIEQQRDKELWNDLLDYAMKDPKYISDLLENVGSHINPVILVQRIPYDREIPHLRDRLVKIISDNNLQRALHEGCSSILQSDTVTLMDRLLHQQRRAVRVSNTSKCAICGGLITISDRENGGIIVLLCRHSYHYNCLKTALGPSESHSAAPSSSSSSSAASSSSSGTAPDLVRDRFEPLRGEKLFCIICQAQQVSMAEARRRRLTGTST